MLQNGRLHKMMEGLERFRRELENDPIAADSVELCIVSYGGTSARVECDFESPDRLKITELHADGETPLADAVFTAHTILQRRLERYNEVGLYRGNSPAKNQRDFFGWLSRSIQKTSRSLSGEEVKYDPTAEWGEVKTVYKR